MLLAQEDEGLPRYAALIAESLLSREGGWGRLEGFEIAPAPSTAHFVAEVLVQ